MQIPAITYNDHLEQLLKDTQQKASSFANSGPDDTAMKRAAWEAAEHTYSDFLDDMRTGKINPKETMQP